MENSSAEMAGQRHIVSPGAYRLRARNAITQVEHVPNWLVIPLLLLLAYLPYAEVVHDYLNYQIFGFAAEVTVIPTVVVLLLFAATSMLRKPVLLIYLTAFFFLMVVVLICRYWWALDLSWNDSLREAVGMRYMILIPIYICLSGYALQNAAARRFATNIILINSSIAAVVGILYVTGLISYRVVPEGSSYELLYIYAADELSRASGLSAGVNVYASFLVLGLIVACFAYESSTVARIAVIPLLILGILSSQSRWPLTCAVIVLASTLVLQEKSRNKKRLLLVAFAVAVALGAVYFISNSGTVTDGIRGRLSQHMGDDIGLRQSKYEIGLRAIFDNTYTVLAGATPENLIQGYREEYIFSDNGVLSMFITAGIPVTLAFIFLCFRLGRIFAKGHRGLAIYVFAGVAFSVLFFNNAIYWDSWLLHAAIVCFLIASRMPERKIVRRARVSPREDHPNNAAVPLVEPPEPLVV